MNQEKSDVDCFEECKSLTTSDDNVSGDDCPKKISRGDPYQEFLKEQDREANWSEATKTKRARVEVKQSMISRDASLADWKLKSLSA